MANAKDNASKATPTAVLVWLRGTNGKEDMTGTDSNFSLFAVTPGGKPCPVVNACCTNGGNVNIPPAAQRAVGIVQGHVDGPLPAPTALDLDDAEKATWAFIRSLPTFAWRDSGYRVACKATQFTEGLGKALGLDVAPMPTWKAGGRATGSAGRGFLKG